MRITGTLRRCIARIRQWLAREICKREWHVIDFQPERYPWDRSILGGFRMYCRRCGETLGYIGP